MSITETRMEESTPITLDDEIDRIIDAVGFKQVLEVFQNIAKQNGVVLEQKVDKPKQNNPNVDLLESIVRDHGEDLVGVAVSAHAKKGTTFFNFHNEWMPVALIGEVRCMGAAMEAENLNKQRKVI